MEKYKQSREQFQLLHIELRNIELNLKSLIRFISSESEYGITKCSQILYSILMIEFRNIVSLKTSIMHGGAHY